MPFFFWKITFLQIANEYNFIIDKMVETREEHYNQHSSKVIFEISKLRKANEHPRLIIRFESIFEPQDVEDLKISEIVPLQLFDENGFYLLVLYNSVSDKQSS